MDLLPKWIGAGFGRFQVRPKQKKAFPTTLASSCVIFKILTYVLTGLMISVHCCQMMCMRFIAYPVEHWCARPGFEGALAELTEEEWRNISAPQGEKCQMYDIDYSGM